MKPLLIGLTGGIGTGKSTAAKILASFHAQLVVGDELGRQVLNKYPELLSEIRNKFGQEVFLEDEELDRKALADRAFESQENTNWLTKLTFPKIYELWKKTVSQSRDEVIVFDAALIFEWGIAKEFDFILVVQASPEKILERALQNTRFSPEQLKQRMQSQISPEVKVAEADFVINNSSTQIELENQMKHFWIKFIEPELEKRKQKIVP